jgi:hypothetical protein
VCVDIVKKDNMYCCKTNNGDIIAENIIFAIPQHALYKINYLKAIQRSLLDCVIDKAIMRIYLKFPLMNDRVWFEDLNGITVTNTILRQIVVINKKLGLLMIYITGNVAISLENLNRNNVLEHEVMFHLRRIFSGVNIPNPLKIYNKYWSGATHMWVPNVDSSMISEQIIKPMRNENIFIVGEAYSTVQQWSEGALQSVDMFINTMVK